MRHSGNEVIEVGNLRQNIVADDEVGAFAFGDEAVGKVRAEEFDDRRNILLPRGCRDIGGRLDAGHGHAQSA